jgi:thiol-disulfide isomerase/thioredoxin
MGHARLALAGIALFFVAAVAMLTGIGASKNAPRFHARSLYGRTFDNDSVKGRVVLIQFWATWCGYCRRDESAVEDVVSEFGSKLLVLAVNVNESRQAVEKYLGEHSRSPEIVLSRDTNLPAAFGARSFPYYVVIDKEGRVAGDQRGAGGTPALYQLLAKAGL